MPDAIPSGRQKEIEAGVAVLAAILAWVIFHFHGNASHAAVEGKSIFNWVAYQWTLSGGDFSHGWIMPLISLGVVVWKRKQLAAAEKRPSLAGLAVVALSLLLHVAAYRAQQPRISLIALVGVLWGVPYCLYGRQVAGILLFPCAYLLLCFTSSFLVSITFRLRLFASALSTGLLGGLGIEALRKGTAIYSAAGDGFQFDVADACSGLRSLVVMTALAAPYAYLTQSTLARKWILFLAAVPLAVVANVTRIVTIALVAEHLGQELALSIYHDYSGYLVFGVAAALLVSTGHLINVQWKERLRAWTRSVSGPRQP